jgi:hypothetical protein
MGERKLSGEKLAWRIRWHIARVMIHAALRIAPTGAARSRLVDYLDAFGREVAAAVKGEAP